MTPLTTRLGYMDIVVIELNRPGSDPLDLYQIFGRPVGTVLLTVLDNGLGLLDTHALEGSGYLLCIGTIDINHLGIGKGRENNQ